jgi:hypothetical protein
VKTVFWPNNGVNQMEMRNQELDSAISALSSAVEAMGRRVIGIDDALSIINANRQDYITKTAEGLLTGINPSVLRALRDEFPQFVTGVVEDSFAKNKKFLGLFATQAYTHTLTLLRTRLASHLDQIKYGDLQNKEMLETIDELITEKRQISAATKDTLDLIKVMQQARSSGVELPPVARDQIHAIAKAARTGGPLKAFPRKARASSTVSSFHSHSSSYASNNDSDFDLLFYIATDIPTSLRTLMIDAISDHQVRREEMGGGGSFGGGGASGDYSTPNDNSGNQGFDGGNNSSISDGAVFVGGAALGGAAVVGGAALLMDDAPVQDYAPAQDNSPAQGNDSPLTDDSLGYFS